MKVSLFAIALAAAGIAAAPATSFAQDKGGFFINGNVGQTTLDRGVYDDDDTGYGVNAGYRWALSPSVALGVEGGYTNLGSFDPDNNIVSPNGVALGKADVKGWNAGVNGHFNLTDNWYVSGRAGLFRADVEGDYLITTGPVRVDDTSNKLYAGAGFGYDFSNNFSVGVNYDYYRIDKNNLDLNPSLVSASAEVRF